MVAAVRSSIDECVEYLNQADLFACDVESSTFSPFTGRLTGMSISVDTEYVPADCHYGCCQGEMFPKSWYFHFVPEFRTEFSNEQALAVGEEVHSLIEVREKLSPFLSHENKKKVFHGGKFDLKQLWHAGFPVKHHLIDTCIASSLLDEERQSHALKVLAKDFLNHDMVKYKELGTFFAPPIQKYGADDAVQTLRLWRLFEPRIEEEGLSRLLHDIDCRLIPVLANMEMWGIKIDLDKLDEIAGLIETEIRWTEQGCYDLAGREFMLTSTQEVGRLLFQELKWKIKGNIPKTKAGTYSTDKTYLSRYARGVCRSCKGVSDWEKGESAQEDCSYCKGLGGAFPLASGILKHRQLLKMRDTYVLNLREAATKIDGRIRPRFNQVKRDFDDGGGTVTGRLSSSTDKELGGVQAQNIPVRSKLGREIRKVFIAPDGKVLIVRDFSQLEYRLAGSISGDQNIIEAYTAWICGKCGKAGSTTESLHSCPECGEPEDGQFSLGKDFHQLTADACGVERFVGKCVSLITPVVTSQGFRRLQDYIEEDFAGQNQIVPEGLTTVTTHGSSAVISGVFSGQQKTLMVFCRFGVVRCTPEHRFVLASGELKAAKDLKSGDALEKVNIPKKWIGTPQTVRLNPFWGGRKDSQAPVVDPEGPCFLHLDDGWAYLAGLFAAEGCCSNTDGYTLALGKGPRFDWWRKVIEDHCQSLGLPTVYSEPKARSGATIRIGSRRVARFLRQIGMADRKGKVKTLSIPTWVTSGPEENAWSYLAGLLDGDGTTNSGSNFSITNKNAEFVGELALLCRCLGLEITIDVKLNKQYKRWYTRLRVWSRSLKRLLDKAPLKHLEKKQQLVARVKQVTKPRDPYEEDQVKLVLDVSEVGSSCTNLAASPLYVAREDPIPVGDFFVASEKHLYAPGGIATHNTLNFALIFGMIAKTLDERHLRCGLKKAVQMHKAYFAQYPGLPRYYNRCVKLLQKQGYVTNLFGRRRRFPHKMGNEVHPWQHEYRQVINYPVQSSAADLVKLAMRNIHERLEREGLSEHTAILMQIHDEVVVETPIEHADYVDELVQDEMEHAVKSGLRVPIIASGGYAPSWGEAK